MLVEFCGGHDIVTKMRYKGEVQRWGHSQLPELVWLVVLCLLISDMVPLSVNVVFFLLLQLLFIVHMMPLSVNVVFF